MFKTLTDGCNPTRGSKFSACVDLYASEDMVIGAGETKLVGLGIAIDIKDLRFALIDKGEIDSPMDEDGTLLDADMADVYTRLFCESHYLQLMLRSSLSKELVIANGVGVIDLDYKDEIKIRLHNPIKIRGLNANAKGRGLYEHFMDCEFKINKGDKIAQITLLEHKGYLFGIDSKEERTGGFGSSGK